jgi:predicted N-acetyltransferase YhbS
MSDMLVSLLTLPDDREIVDKLKDEGILVRRIQPFEISLLRRFVLDTFGEGWADEVSNAFGHQPPTCFVATTEKRIIGFGAYECTRRDYFGPTGVHPDFRSKGIGKALLLACLRSMYELGYAYAIIGGVGPADFYTRVAGAIPIPDSTPGVYVDMLSRDKG